MTSVAATYILSNLSPVVRVKGNSRLFSGWLHPLCICCFIPPPLPVSPSHHDPNPFYTNEQSYIFNAIHFIPPLPLVPPPRSWWVSQPIMGRSIFLINRVSSPPSLISGQTRFILLGNHLMDRKPPCTGTERTLPSRNRHGIFVAPCDFKTNTPILSPVGSYFQTPCEQE